MIEILRVSKEGIKVLDAVEDNCWVNVIEPSEEELQRLKQIFNIPDETINSLRDVDEIPTLEEHEGYSFIIIRAPYNHPKSEFFYITEPLGIFLNDNFVITLCFQKSDVIDRIKQQPFDFKKSQFVLRLLLASSKLYLTYLKNLHKLMIKNEDELGDTHKNKIIMDFLDLEKSFVYFNTSINSNYILLDKLKKDPKLMKYKENSIIMEHIDEETRQAIQMTEIYSNILSNTLDAFASIISNNLNVAMKTLTSLTMIFSIPMLIASVYGMNVDIPFAHIPHAFFFVLFLSIALSSIAIYIFAKKKFF